MTSPENIFSTLHDWVVLATDLTGNKVAQYDANAPEATGKTFVINPNASLTPIGLMDETQYTASGQYSVTGHDHQLASLHCYGPGANAKMKLVRACQDAPSIRKLFRDQKLTLVECGTIRDLSAKKGARVEERAQMDVRLRHATTITDTVPTTQTIELETQALEFELDTDPDVLTDVIEAP